MTEAMAFWSVILPPKGKPVQQEVESTPSVLSSIHVTGMALGPNAKDGPHTVTVEYDGTNTVLATLEAPHVRQWRLDVAIDQVGGAADAVGTLHWFAHLHTCSAAFIEN